MNKCIHFGQHLKKDFFSLIKTLSQFQNREKRICVDTGQRLVIPELLKPL